MSLQTRLGDLITAIGTDYKQLRTFVTGSGAGTLTGLTTTVKTDVVSAINEVNAKAAPTPPASSEIISGIIEIATQVETNTGTDDIRAVTPLKFQTRLAAFAQPLSTNLSTLAGVVSGAFGRTLLGTADAASAKTALGLATVATTGSASDITVGTLPTSVMPLLAINDTFVVVSQAAMLALTAQRGDIAKRTDLNGQAFVLQADAPSVLGNWIGLNTTSDVSSVNGQTGTVVVTKTDVGLSNVDNTADASKPVSTAQAAADALKLAIALNLSDLNNVITARTNLSVYSQADIGNPETDLVALYTTAKV